MEELEANEEVKTIDKWDDYDLKVDLLREYIHMDLKTQISYKKQVYYLLLKSEMSLHKHLPVLKNRCFYN